MWIELEKSLRKSIKFKDFKTAWAFMSEVALVSEQINHHPTWENSYNTVKIELQTHDAANIVTQKDKLLASEIDQILTKYPHELI
ncbi:MAG: 4a-hydroxytetrahydrobiopterin dehydratase [Saprospiraceae bacterium]|nr:4a-hydroxytetrahydrobiopterin dehydratase [Saprospiraceae bacterium]